MQRMVGGCLCGKIRYTAEADPVFTALCHCRNCQKQAGTSFSVVVAIPASELSVTGAVKTYEDTGESGKPVHRNFATLTPIPASIINSMPALHSSRQGRSMIRAG